MFLTLQNSYPPLGVGVGVEGEKSHVEVIEMFIKTLHLNP